MSKLPSLDEYNGVVQNPKTAFTDPLLQSGQIATDNYGLPIPTSGGFAVTYELTRANQRFAVRVFHRDSPDLHRRYAAISQTLAGIKSPYFVDFQFQNQGIRVNGSLHPIVRMDWIEGDTLGNYLEANFRNRTAIEKLRSEIHGAGNLLEQHKIAHGDLQTGNILVANNRIRLIDYDGMFVQNLASMSASELGHRNFQHPGRTAKHFNPQLDRFSLIVLDLSLDVVAQSPEYFAKYGTTGDNIIFTGIDYTAPDSSDVFAELIRNPNFRNKAERLATLCKSDFDKIPSLEDFRSGRWAPSVSLTPRQSSESTPAFVEVVRDVYYQGTVLDATDFNRALNMEGDRVEMIGKVVEVKSLDSKYRASRRQAYLVFINFGNWRGKQLKASIRGPRAQSVRDSVDASWTGQWVSVTGMVEPVYRRAGYEHIAITVSEKSQLHRITAEEAQFRLGKPKQIRVKVPAPAPAPRAPAPSNVWRSNNEKILEDIVQATAGYSTPNIPISKPSPPAAPPKSRNQQLLDQLAASASQAPTSTSAPARPQTPVQNQTQPPVSAPSTQKPSVPATPKSAPAATPPAATTSNNKGCGCLIMIIVAVVILYLINRK